MSVKHTPHKLSSRYTEKQKVKEEGRMCIGERGRTRAKYIKDGGERQRSDESEKNRANHSARMGTVSEKQD